MPRLNSKLFLFWLCLFFTPAWSLYAQTLHIAVASNFAPVLKKIIPDFEQQSGHKVVISTGSSGALYAQIMHGAPFDVFLSADRQKVQKLIEQGRAVKNSRFSYATGRLVLWSATRQEGKSLYKKLLGQQFKRLVIARPKLAPYGLAAKQFLQKQGLWKKIQPKLVQAQNIAQAHQFTDTKSVDMGLVALSQLVGKVPPQNYWIVPEQDYAPIRQDAVLIQQKKDLSVARSLMFYLASPKVQALIKRFGYQ